MADVGNIYSVTLPGDYFTVDGTTEGYHGFAYAIDDDDLVVFTDPVQDVSLQVSIPSGSLQFSSPLFAYDIDGDGDDEFACGNYNGLNYEILVIDFNDLSVTSYISPTVLSYPVGAGDFNGDGEIDLLLKSVTRRDMSTLNLVTNSSIGEWHTPAAEPFDSQVVGKFWDGQKDYIALEVEDPATIRERNITLVDGNGTLLTQ
ncbi:MAG: hypothetical protein P1Q69_05310, partial [Candidatus Thorarchaeota archaeon]|nr:hypothetical protein [Candidatus Thorarchaeota archaeon]